MITRFTPGLLAGVSLLATVALGACNPSADGGTAGAAGAAGSAGAPGAGGSSGSPAAPSTLLAKVSGPGDLVQDGDSLVLTSYDFDVHAGALVRVALADGEATTLVGGDPGHSVEASLGANATTFFYALQNGADSTVFALPRAGGAPAKVADVAGQVSAIAADDARVYFTAAGVDASTGALYSAPVAGGATTTLASGFQPGGGLAVDATSAYWSTLGPKGPAGTGTVQSVSLTGGPAHTLADGQRWPSKLALDGTDLYFLDTGAPGVDCTPSDGSLMKLSITGAAAPVSLADNLKGARSLAVADGGVFVAEGGHYCNVPPTPSPGTISKVPTKGGALETLSAPAVQRLVVSVEKREVYWTTLNAFDGSGTVERAGLLGK
jgi:hypothetical protein